LRWGWWRRSLAKHFGKGGSASSKISSHLKSSKTVRKIESCNFFYPQRQIPGAHPLSARVNALCGKNPDPSICSRPGKPGIGFRILNTPSGKGWREARKAQLPPAKVVLPAKDFNDLSCQ
jgi:hypothetical protein